MKIFLSICGTPIQIEDHKTPAPINFSQFKRCLTTFHPQLSDFFESSSYSTEVFDKYSQEFCPLQDEDQIPDSSHVRCIPGAARSKRQTSMGCEPSDQCPHRRSLFEDNRVEPLTSEVFLPHQVVLHVDDLSEKARLCQSVMRFGKFFTIFASEPNFSNTFTWKLVEWKMRCLSTTHTTRPWKELKNEFSRLVMQYRYILVYKRCWSEAQAKAAWPLFFVFHYELNLVPFMDGVQLLQNAFNKHPKLCVCQGQTSDERISDSEPKAHRVVMIEPLNHDLNITDFASMFQLIEVMYIYRNQYKSPSTFWDLVSLAMIQHFNKALNAAGWQTYFNHLLQQYLYLLRWKPGLSVNQYHRLWPLFVSFFRNIDLEIFGLGVATQSDLDIVASLHEKSAQDDVSIEDTESFIEFDLLEAVKKKASEGFRSKTESQFWNSVAAELKHYVDSSFGQSSYSWQYLFKLLLTHFFSPHSIITMDPSVFTTISSYDFLGNRFSDGKSLLST